MPNPLSLYLHNLPLWFHKVRAVCRFSRSVLTSVGARAQVEVLFNHFVELVCPVLVMLPYRPARLGAALLQLFYMVALGLGGNYAFVQVLVDAYRDCLVVC